MKLGVLFVSSAIVGVASLAACGSDGSEFPDGSSSSGASGTSGPGIGASGGSSSDAGLSEDGQFSKCAESRDAAKRLPLHLVLLLDRSSSMCRYDDDDKHRDCDQVSSRWTVVAGALSAFFGNPETTGITLSLLPFPANGDREAQCSANYASGVTLEEEPLPSSSLAGELASVKPPNSGYVTPTTPAMRGVLDFARALKAQVNADERVAVLFATDGQPRDCGSEFPPDFGYVNDDIGPAAQAAQAAAQNDGIATYVIGLDTPGENLTANLTTLAAAAGTAPPALISISDPTAAAVQLKDALNAVRGKALGCELIVPAPAPGKTLDPEKVNVVYRPGDGSGSRILPYSQDCSNKDGWTYDNVTAPTRITLCATSCALAQNDPEGRLEVVLGCETKTGPVN